MFYKIAGIYIKIRNFYLENDVWRLFQCEEKDDIRPEAEIEMVTSTSSESNIYPNLEIYSEVYEGDKLVRRDGDLMLVCNDWSYAKIFPLMHLDNGYSYLIQIFYSHAIKHKMIQIHSSLVKFHEKGILFLGPSGVGKTTQAELWKYYREAVIINGDMNFVQEKENQFYAWGTPWHGKSPYCINTKVVVHALIILKQDIKNSIRELGSFEKVTKVSNSVFYPEWIENGVQMCLETLDHLLSRIPVYELSCRPDEEAVKLTEETIFGSSSVSD